MRPNKAERWLKHYLAPDDDPAEIWRIAPAIRALVIEREPGLGWTLTPETIEYLRAIDASIVRAGDPRLNTIIGPKQALERLKIADALSPLNNEKPPAMRAGFRAITGKRRAFTAISCRSRPARS